MQTLPLERRRTQFKAPVKGLVSRLPLEWVLGAHRAKEVRGLLRRSYMQTLEHDIQSGKIQSPEYLPGVDLTGHCIRVGGCALSIAQALEFGIDDQLKVMIAGMLHDVGKTDQSLHLLRRPLTDEERQKIHDHQYKSAQFIVTAIQQLHDKENIAMMREVQGIVGRHHFPETENDLVVHIADKYIAMTEPRDRPSKAPFEAVTQIQEDLIKQKYYRFGHFRKAILEGLSLVSGQQGFSNLLTH